VNHPLGSGAAFYIAGDENLSRGRNLFGAFHKIHKALHLLQKLVLHAKHDWVENN